MTWVLNPDGKNNYSSVLKNVIFVLSLTLPPHPDGFEEVQVGQEVALRLI